VHVNIGCEPDIIVCITRGDKMKAFFLVATVAVGPALAGFDSWSPPGPYDGMNE